MRNNNCPSDYNYCILSKSCIIPVSTSSSKIETTLSSSPVCSAGLEEISNLRRSQSSLGSFQYRYSIVDLCTFVDILLINFLDNDAFVYSWKRIHSLLRDDCAVDAVELCVWWWYVIKTDRWPSSGLLSFSSISVVSGWTFRSKLVTVVSFRLKYVRDYKFQYIYNLCMILFSRPHPNVIC